MGKVLISFIGRPESAARCRECHSVLQCSNPECARATPGCEGETGYRTATYDFTTDNGTTYTTPLFGAALLKHLQSQPNPPERWLVLGTAQSIWDALADALPEEKTRDPEVLCLKDEIHQRVKAGNADPDLLKDWGAVLSKHLGVNCSCEIIGSGDSEEDQQKMWAAIDAHVEKGDHLVMDVTHAFRNLPILASFMIMFLRWTKEVRSVDLVYGAFRMGSDKSVTPVVHLHLCQQLLEASEAVAILKHTGNYVPLASAAGLDKETLEAVERHAFLDEVQPIHGATQAVLDKLQTVSPTTVPEKPLVDRLRETVEVSATVDLAKRMRERAERAKEHREYQQAALLLYEAILEAGITRFTEEEPGTETGRNTAREKIRDWARMRKLKGVFEDLRCVRNRAAHASEDEGEVRPNVKAALEDPKAFERLFKDGLNLLDRLLAIRPRARACSSSTSTTRSPRSNWK